jgi:glycosyltransferase involved in cell wall biosynthesis
MVPVDVVLANGVPVDRIAWSAHAGERLLFAGRFSPEKGTAEAIEIAVGAGMPITVVGDPYDPRYAAERIEPFRGVEGVEILPALPRADVWTLMASSRAVLCPVSWDEPFGLVAAEANAAGSPVVAFDRGALSEVVVDRETGALVADVEEAVDAVASIDRIDRRRCRSHAEVHLDLARTLDAHEELYAHVVEAKGARR